MLTGLLDTDGAREVLPFVRLFYGDVSEYLWSDDGDVTHRVRQGEGGEQGDALMPALYALAQHPGLQAVVERLEPGERLYAFLDDV